MPKYGADGDFGTETIDTLKKYGLLTTINESTFNVLTSAGDDLDGIANQLLSVAVRKDFNCENVPAATAILKYPEGMTTDEYGNIFFTDGYGALLRRIDTSGIITTIAGSVSSTGYNGDGIPAVNAQFIRGVWYCYR